MPQSASYFGDIPSGTAGTRATLKIMVMVARKALKPTTPDGTQNLLTFRTTAQRLAQACGEKDYWCEATQLQVFVRDGIRYLRDMRSAELVQTPEITLRERSGDCDDKSLLLAVLAETIGFSARFCAIGVQGQPYSHVSAQLLIPSRGWVNAETIPINDSGEKAALGWFPPDATCLMLAHI
jgi:transglutaminase-like putative cysteine protease